MNLNQWKTGHSIAAAVVAVLVMAVVHKYNQNQRQEREEKQRAFVEKHLAETPVYLLKNQPCGEDAAYILAWREVAKRIPNGSKAVFKRGHYREGISQHDFSTYAGNDTVYWVFDIAVNHLDNKYASVRTSAAVKMNCQGTQWKLNQVRIIRTEPWKP
jgi:hypothetical protein